MVSDKTLQKILDAMLIPFYWAIGIMAMVATLVMYPAMFGKNFMRRARKIYLLDPEQWGP